MIEIALPVKNAHLPGHAVFLASGQPGLPGSAVVPFECGTQGSTVFLPFTAQTLHRIQLGENGASSLTRAWKGFCWDNETPGTVEAQFEENQILLKIPLAVLPTSGPFHLAVYAKDLRQNHGWGRLLPVRSRGIPGGFGDQSIPGFFELNLAAGSSVWRTRHSERPRIYQLLPRLFGNTNPTRRLNGTLQENGVGRFEDINDAALRSLRDMGFTHLWLTGVLRQATGTAHPGSGLEADDPDILKGIAGSPYAIKDYFDVCPDYATAPDRRMEEFKSLLARIRSHGMGTLIDFVPNHVSRAYQSLTGQPLGSNDRTDRFCDPANHFFHLTDQPLVLPTWKDGLPLSPTCKVLGGCDGRFLPETNSARVSGNNVARPTPSLDDWYETAKLNYGYDFTTGHRAYPHGDQPGVIPKTWLSMDAVLAHWQALGVDGFRCDMAHMVPPEFWTWAIARARARNPAVFFVGEAYEDLMKVPSGYPLQQALNDRRGHVLLDLLSAGFDAVYDDPSYKKLKHLYDGQGWANDLTEVLHHPFLLERSLRYAENHDEVRLASHGNWGGIGMEVGRPVSAILFGLSHGPVLLYHGQEVGEPGHGPCGFSTDGVRTTIFDYWSMPELARWVNGHRYDGAHLNPEQTALRGFYSRLLHLCGKPAFARGELLPLNPANIHNPEFGRLAGETASGHWLHAYLRHDPRSNESYLVTANLHRSVALQNIRIQLPPEAQGFLAADPETPFLAEDELNDPPLPPVRIPRLDEGICIPELPPLSAVYWQLKRPR